jgi:pimeloyl-ACP methyl ester carboxylesterase
MEPTSPHLAPPAAEAIETGRSRRWTLGKLFFRAWLLLAVGFAFYLYISYRASGFASSVLVTDARVAVTVTSDAITFAPTRQTSRSALIFIPGAMVEPTAYAPLARSVAEHGYTATIVKLPWRMASSDAQRQAVVSRVSNLTKAGGPAMKWVVAGHSVGGVVACQVARDHAEKLSGLVLIGTSHPRDFDLSHLSLDVTKIAATNDGLASLAEVKSNAKRLPLQTRLVVIEGGNHSQFGYYGFQLGDHRATISRSAQQAATMDAILDTLGRTNADERR